MKPKPMLSGKAPADLSKLKYPLIATPKLDGIRCLTRDFREGLVEGVSRTLKPIPNEHIQTQLFELGIPGLDGELMIPGAETFGDTSSAIMKKTGEPDFEYHVFDMWDTPRLAYSTRLQLLRELLKDTPEWVKFVRPQHIYNQPGLERYEEECLKAGHEGIMVRDPEGLYKYGRSTTKEGGLLKLKRFEDSEAVIIGFEEEMHNENPATLDAFGRTERSSHKANKVGKGTLGAFVCVTHAGVEFKIGTGFDRVDRVRFWEGRESLMRVLVKFRHQPHGEKDAPRCPVFLGFRHQDDL